MLKFTIFNFFFKPLKNIYFLAQIGGNLDVKGYGIATRYLIRTRGKGRQNKNMYL